MAAAGKEGGRGKKIIKNAVSPFVDASGKQILMLLSASDERFGVFRVRDFFYQDLINEITVSTYYILRISGHYDPSSSGLTK